MPVQIPDLVTATQNDWRFCKRCLGLFWNGLTHNGHCPHPDGGAHQADSWDFYLLADPAHPVQQPPDQPTGP
jgi:hypothetical protein